MRKVLRIAGMVLALAAPVLAAEEGGEHNNLMLYRVINFAILAVALGYLIKKNAGPFFAARNKAIAWEITEARRLAQESEARARAIDERLNRLDGEIESLRSAATVEMSAEHQRLEQQTEQAVRKVFSLAEQEMGAMAKAARLELRSFAASLAVGLAEKKIASRITPDTERRLVGEFMRNL